MNKVENQYKDIKRIKDIKDKNISFKFSNFKHYVMIPMLIVIGICLIIIIGLISNKAANIIYEPPMIVLFIFLIFLFLSASLYSYFSNYNVVYFGEKNIIVKSFLGKETVFDLRNHIGIYIRKRNHIGKGSNIKTTEMYLQDKETKKVRVICIDAIKEELIEKFFNNLIYE